MKKILAVMTFAALVGVLSFGVTGCDSGKGKTTPATTKTTSPTTGATSPTGEKTSPAPTTAPTSPAKTN